MRCAILGYGCQTPTNHGARAFYKDLLKGQRPSTYTWSVPFDPERKDQSLTLLTHKLVDALADLQHSFSCELSSNWGLILASTKGCIDDYVWDADRSRRHSGVDSIEPVLQTFLRATQLSPKLSLCVSNACASSLSAIFLAQRWLWQKRVDQVLVVACDRVGPFVEKGFQCLQVVSPTFPRPFAANRDGLRLGESAAAVLLERPSMKDHEICVTGVGIDVEGYAVTRPSPSGQSVRRALDLCLSDEKSNTHYAPDVVIAHGTGTEFNDAAEDKAFSSRFGVRTPITGTKWLIGHTLGTSGLMDVIATCEMFRHQRAFGLMTTEKIDPEFSGRYLSAADRSRDESADVGAINDVLVSSLGFGGVHAVARLQHGAHA